MNPAVVNWDAVLAIAQIVGDVFVFLSLIYVGLQIREDARARRAQTMHQQSAAYNAILDSLAKDKDLAELYSRGAQGTVTLSGIEALQYGMFIGELLRVFEDTYLQFLRGHLDPKVWKGMEVPVKHNLDAPGTREVWRMQASMFSEEFPAYVERALRENPTPQVLDVRARLASISAQVSQGPQTP